MSETRESQPVFPRQGPTDISSSVSSLTRGDIEGFLRWVTDDPELELSDWHWRVLVGLGLVNQEERYMETWQAMKASRRSAFVAASAEEVFPEVVSDGLRTYAARDYAYGHELETSFGNFSRQVRGSRAIWVRMSSDG